MAFAAKGIHKPAGLESALTIRQSLEGPYRGSIIQLPDGTRQFRYAQEGSDPSYFTNRALIACMRDSVPIGVLIQVRSMPNPRYRVLGLGQVVDWNAGTFTICQFSHITHDSIGLESPLDVIHAMDGRDARLRTLQSITVRRGQPAFRSDLISLWREMRRIWMQRYTYPGGRTYPSISRRTHQSCAEWTIASSGPSHIV